MVDPTRSRSPNQTHSVVVVVTFAPESHSGSRLLEAREEEGGQELARRHKEHCPRGSRCRPVTARRHADYRFPQRQCANVCHEHEHAHEHGPLRPAAAMCTPSAVRRIAISICSRNQRAGVVAVVGRSPPPLAPGPPRADYHASPHLRTPPSAIVMFACSGTTTAVGRGPDFRPSSRPRAPRHMGAGGRRGPQGHKAQRWNRPRRPSSRRGWESEGEGGRARGGLMYCFVEGDGEA